MHSHSVSCHSIAIHPIIFVNGLAGSQLTATLKDVKPPHWICKTTASNYSLWLNPTLILPEYRDCLFYYLKLRYNEGFPHYLDQEGISIEPPSFGSVDALAYLDPSIKIPQIGYFEELINYLQGKGYSENQNLFAAPFDWRLASDGLSERGYYHKVQSLVEKAYESNGNSSVVFLSHSMGGPVILDFFNQMTVSWKEKYISKFIALSPPFGGAISSLRAGISGDNFGIPFASEDIFLPIQRGAASGPWLFPQGDLWSPDEVLGKKQFKLPRVRFSFSSLLYLYSVYSLSKLHLFVFYAIVH
jgi:hypothetical protein